MDKYGAIIDFYLSKKRDEPATRKFFKKAIGSSGLPSKVVIDKSDANIAKLDTLNVRLWLSGYMLFMIEVLTIKYLNNIAEQNHRKVKNASMFRMEVLGWC